MGFTKEQLDAMVRDAERIRIGEDDCLQNDVACYVRALAAEVERLQAKLSLTKDNVLVGRGDRVFFPFNGRMRSGNLVLVLESTAINVDASACYADEAKARMFL